ncbi:MAG: hypothetical protein RQ844_05030, partial [Thermocrinis sp.]|nr:hypothetical protein [Thermocrinis sp.]
AQDRASKSAPSSKITTFTALKLYSGYEKVSYPSALLSSYLDLPTGFSLVFLQALFGILVFVSVLFLKWFRG